MESFKACLFLCRFVRVSYANNASTLSIRAEYTLHTV
jgi:hypothetical protein